MSRGREIKVHIQNRVLELLEIVQAVHVPDVRVNPRFVCVFMKPGLCALITVVTCADVTDVASGYLWLVNAR